ncbi:hypothetical protein [Lysobacter arvi]|nr:hypothetical protein [Lysobacter arvi]
MLDRALVEMRGGYVRFHEADLIRRAKAGEFAKRFRDKYERFVNVPLMPVALQQFDNHAAMAKVVAARRAPDHLTWLQSEALLKALDAYDDSDIGSGLCFAHQTGLCVLGMDGDERGAEVLQQWWRADKPERPNLALRGYVLNQKSIAAAFEQMVAKLRADDGGDVLATFQANLQQAKDLAAQYSAVDGYLNTLSEYSHVNTAGALAWIGSLGTQALRAGAPNTLDKALHRRLSVLLTAQLGTRALNLRLAEHAQTGHVPDPARVRRPMLRTLDRAFVASLNNANSNELYKLRLGSGLLLLEAALLLMQAQKLEGDAKWAAQLAAAALTTGAAGLEVMAIGTEQVLARTTQRSVTYQGARISLGRFRLWGAALATAGGVVGIALDWQEGKAAWKTNSALSSAYFVRIGATAVLLTSQGFTAFAQASAYLTWKAQEAVVLRKGWALLAKGSTRLAANRALMLLLGRVAFWAGVVVTIGTVALMILDADALEEWCDRCCYRLNKSEKPYASQEEDLGALLGAIEDVV